MKTKQLKVEKLIFAIFVFCCCINGFSQKAVNLKTDVCIVGAGSAGIGASLAASRAGANVILIEKEGIVGGNSTMSYVNNWEPGPGCSFSREIYFRLSQEKNAIGVALQRHRYRQEEPYGLCLVDTTLNYNHSLRRSDLDVSTESANVVFDIEAFNRTVQEMLKETKKTKLLLNTAFTKAYVENSIIKSIEAKSSSGEEYLIEAKVFIDCTGSGYLSRKAGANVMLGEEPKSMFGEPSAPDKPGNSLNAISLCYQIRPLEDGAPAIIGSPDDFDYKVSAYVTGPIGNDRKFTINPLGIIEGNLLFKNSADSLHKYGKKIVDRHWRKLRTFPHFREYQFDSYAPSLGIRESYRVVCEYILNQNDLLAGLSGQGHRDIITIADHPMDLHGKNSSLKILSEPYGVPFRSLIPRGIDNLLVAGKCAGFSHIAASSCRLSRTMMSTGHAAGFAAWICSNEGRPVWDVPVERIQAEMNLKLRPKEKVEADPLPINKVIGESKYNFLIADNGNDSIYELSNEGDIIWSYPASNVQDVWSLSNGNLLFTYYYGESGMGGVKEVTKNKMEVFNFETSGEVHTCQRLSNGNTLIGVNKTASLLEVTNKGKIKKTIRLKTSKRGHDVMRMARQLENGNYLVCQEGDQLVVEYDKRGKLLNTFSSPGKCFDAIRLENGNTLISDGSACSVREVDKMGTVVWQITKDDFPEIKMNWLTGMEVLSNGNIVVCNWLGHGKEGQGIPFFEITKEKKVVFYYTDNMRTRSLSNLKVLNN